MPRSNNPKMTIARKMLTAEERKKHVPAFYSEAWSKRYRARQAKLISKQKS